MLTTVDALDNDEIQINFKPLYQCIHIHEALDRKAEFQRNYQEDRKVSRDHIAIPGSTYLQTQATLILASRLSTTPSNLLNTLPLLMQELVGFFIIENHVLRTMPDFRSQLDVDELWNEMCRRIVDIMGQGLKGCGEPEVFLQSKTEVLLFVQTLEVGPWPCCESWLIGRATDTT